MSRIAISIIITIALSGCASTVDFTQYSLPQGKPTAEVELIALDKYRNTDTINLSVLSRNSCSEKPVIANVTWVGSQGFFGKDSFYNTKTVLPANERINLHISNVSSSGYVTTHCSSAGSLILKTQKRYALKVNNWSTKGSEISGFGCGFNIVEIDSSGKEVDRLDLGDVELPQCMTK